MWPESSCACQSIVTGAWYHPKTLGWRSGAPVTVGAVVSAGPAMGAQQRLLATLGADTVYPAGMSFSTGPVGAKVTSMCPPNVVAVEAPS